MKIFMTRVIPTWISRRRIFVEWMEKDFFAIWDCRSYEAYRRKFHRKDVCFNLAKILEELEEHNMLKKRTGFYRTGWGFFWFGQKVDHKVCMKNRVYLNSALKIVLSWLVHQGFQNLSVWRIKCLEPRTATAAWHRRLTAENGHILCTTIQWEENLEKKLNDKRYETWPGRNVGSTWTVAIIIR